MLNLLHLSEKTRRLINFIFYCGSSAIFSGSNFLFYGVFFITIARFDTYYLGIIQGLDSSIGVFASIFIGSLIGKVNIYIISRIGMLLAVIATAILGIIITIELSDTVLIILSFALIPFISIAQSCFWPSVITGISQNNSDNISKYMNIFNVVWSSGKSIGFILIGVGYSIFNDLTSLIIASIGFLIVLVIFPIIANQSHIEKEIPDKNIIGDNIIIEIEDIIIEINNVSEKENRCFMILNYIGNFMGISIFIILGNQYPQYTINHNIVLTTNTSPELFFGLFMFTIFLFQTLLFFTCSLFKAWQYRRLLILMSMVGLLGCSLVIIFIDNAWILMSIAPIFGICGGFPMQSSVIYSSSVANEVKSKYAGIHESIVCLGSLLLPLITAIVVSATNIDNISFIIYAICVASSIPSIEICYRITK